MATSIQEKITKARDAGYNDEEIVKFLGETPDFGPKLKTAIDAGYKPDEILGYLSQPAKEVSEGMPQQRQDIQSQDKSFFDKVGEGVKYLYGGQGTKDIYGGAIRGAASIGTTLMTPFDIAAREARKSTNPIVQASLAPSNWFAKQIGVNPEDIVGRTDRREALDPALQELMGANPESIGYKGGKIGAEIAGTAGLGGLSANALRMIPGVSAAVPNFLNALRTGGFGAGKIVPSVAAGATVGAGTSAMINPEDTQSGGVIGGLLPLLGKGVPAVVNAVTPNVVKEAFAAGKQNATTFLDNLRKNVPVDDVLDVLKNGISQMRNDASASYTTAKTGWAANTKPLDYVKVDAAIDKIDKSITHAGKSIIGADEQKIISEAKDAIAQWKTDHPIPTAVDLDALKRRLDAIYPESGKQTQAKRALSEFESSVKQTIIDAVPEYKNAMKAYETQTKLIREITDALGGSDKIKKETALNKIMQALKQTPSGEYKQALIGQLESQTGQQIKPAIAGQLMSDIVPQSLSGRGALGIGGAASIMNPSLLPVLALTSPRLVGETAYKTGRASGEIQKISQLPLVRNALAGLTSKSTPVQQLILNALNQNQQ